jgi:threonine/homoserine/homoserine lactone efflux protein
MTALTTAVSLPCVDGPLVCGEDTAPMFDSLFWAFVGLAVLVTITPGADTVLTIRNTLAGGTRDGIWTVAGICSGFIFQPLLAALGVARFLSSYLSHSPR